MTSSRSVSPADQLTERDRGRFGKRPEHHRRSRRARWRGSGRRGRCRPAAPGAVPSRAWRRRGACWAPPIRAGRVPASGTAPPGRRFERRCDRRRGCRDSRARAASLNVLHSSRRARRRSRSSNRSSSSSSSTSSRPGSSRRGLEVDQGGRDEQELGRDVEVERLHALELLEVGVDDRRQRDLPEVDLLLQDEVQEEVEGPLEGRGGHLVRHSLLLARCGAGYLRRGIARTPSSLATDRACRFHSEGTQAPR